MGRLVAVPLAAAMLITLGAPAAVADPVEELPADELPWEADPEPSPDEVDGVGAVVVEEPAPGSARSGLSSPMAARSRVPAAPVKALPTTMDAHPGFQATVSCDPVTRRGVQSFADLLGQHYGKPRVHYSRTCKTDASQHYDGRALDWSLNAYDSYDKALGDSVVTWLSAGNGAMAKRFGIMYIIWDQRIWYVHRPLAWERYYGPSPHTDHIHFSFTWDGAMGRTSWWTGTPVTRADHGTCRVYEGQYAPRYTGPRHQPCPTQLPKPPASAYPVYLPGASHSNIRVAQQALGFSGSDVDGSFGPQTQAALLAYQARKGLPVTGVLDKASWAALVVEASTPMQQIIASPDFTGDGRADLFAVDRTGRLFAYPGAGDGRLQTQSAFGTGWSSYRVYAPGDWNGDRLADLVAADSAGRLWLYPGNGSGGLRPRAQIGHGWSTYRIVPAGDLDGDGAADLLGIDEAGRLWLYPGNGTGGFRSRIQVGRGWNGFELHAAGDMNGDGQVDILGIDTAGRLFFYAGRGNGHFAGKAQVGRGWRDYAFASGGDFNGDGIGDLMGRDPQGGLWFYAGRHGGTFAAKVQVGRGW